MLGETWVYPLGDVLCRYAEQVANAAFVEVNRVNDITEIQDTDLILIPKFIDMDQTGPGFRKKEIFILVEWRALDNKKNLIWVTTVRGLGYSFKPKKGLQQAVDDLFRKSLAEILASQELRLPQKR
jgi:hypothetical protein